MATNACAQNREAESKIQSMFIYNFTKYIQWPDELNKGDFIIGVLGDTPLFDELQRMASSKTVNDRKIVVKKYKDAKEVEKNCHIVYLPAEGSNNLSPVLQKTGGNPTLVVTNKDGLGKTGSLINFVSVDGKPRFEMNVSAIERSKLKYAQQLKSIAIVL